MTIKELKEIIYIGSNKKIGITSWSNSLKDKYYDDPVEFELDKSVDELELSKKGHSVDVLDDTVQIWID